MERTRTKPIEKPFVTEEIQYRWVKKGKTSFALRDGRVVKPGEQFNASLSMIPAPFRNMFTQMGMVGTQEENASKSAEKQAKTEAIPAIPAPIQQQTEETGAEQAVVDAVDTEDVVPEVDLDAHADIPTERYKPVFAISGFYFVMDSETNLPIQEGKKFRLGKAKELCDELNNA